MNTSAATTQVPKQLHQCIYMLLGQKHLHWPYCSQTYSSVAFALLSLPCPTIANLPYCHRGDHLLYTYHLALLSSLVPNLPCNTENNGVECTQASNLLQLTPCTNFVYKHYWQQVFDVDDAPLKTFYKGCELDTTIKSNLTSHLQPRGGASRYSRMCKR